MSDGSDGLAEHYHEKEGRHHTSKLRLYNSFGPWTQQVEDGPDFVFNRQRLGAPELGEANGCVYIRHIGWG